MLRGWSWFLLFVAALLFSGAYFYPQTMSWYNSLEGIFHDTAIFGFIIGVVMGLVFGVICGNYAFKKGEFSFFLRLGALPYVASLAWFAIVTYISPVLDVSTFLKTFAVLYPPTFLLVFFLAHLLIKGFVQRKGKLHLEL